VQQYNAHLIVDEAHATGVFGLGLVHQLNLQDTGVCAGSYFWQSFGLPWRYSFGSELLRNYLINFSRSFIYTTAAPFHNWHRL
jgi:8-amino-7-oxononanoate synthase